VTGEHLLLCVIVLVGVVRVVWLHVAVRTINVDIGRVFTYFLDLN